MILVVVHVLVFLNSSIHGSLQNLISLEYVGSVYVFVAEDLVKVSPYYLVCLGCCVQLTSQRSRFVHVHATALMPQALLGQSNFLLKTSLSLPCNDFSQQDHVLGTC